MLTSRRTLFGLVVALQLLALLTFVGVREYTLRNSQEIVLSTVPVDPRDLFRGDYVVLRYEISSLPSSFMVGDTVYVRLVESNGLWKAVDTTREPPAPGVPFIRGRVTQISRSGTERRMDVEYGIESYFVPEGTGRKIEQASGKLRVKAVVDGWGNATIKELLLDG